MAAAPFPSRNGGGPVSGRRGRGDTHTQWWRSAGAPTTVCVALLPPLGNRVEHRPPTTRARPGRSGKWGFRLDEALGAAVATAWPADPPPPLSPPEYPSAVRVVPIRRSDSDDRGRETDQPCLLAELRIMTLG